MSIVVSRARACFDAPRRCFSDDEFETSRVPDLVAEHGRRLHPIAIAIETSRSDAIGPLIPSARFYDGRSPSADA
jgi:hypothetical protein